MKRFLYILALITICFTQAKSQDLIVTVHNDSLNCRITKIDKNDIYFSVVRKNAVKDSLLKTSQVRYYKMNYFVGGYWPPPPTDNMIAPGYPPNIRIHAGAGVSRMLEKIPDYLPKWERAYEKDLRSGYHADLNLNYYTYKTSGFGVKYSILKTSAQAENVAFMHGTTVLGRGLLKDDITEQFIGPTLFGDVRMGKRKSFLLSSQIGIGYVSFLNKSIQVDRFDISSSTLGVSWDLSLDYFITKRLSAGILFSATTGKVKEEWVSEGPSIYNFNGRSASYTYKLDISRMDLGVGIKAYLGTF